MPGSKLHDKVLGFFNRLKDQEIDWVLVGAEALNLCRKRPRATVDADLIVRKKHLGKVKKLLRETCGDVEDTEVHCRARLSPEPQRLDIDVIKSQVHGLFEAALDHRVPIEDVPVPRLEALLALKYLSAVSPGRPRADKYQDIADFIHAFKDNEDKLDRGLLVELSSRAPAAAPTEFRDFLRAVEKDEPVIL